MHIFPHRCFEYPTDSLVWHFNCFIFLHLLNFTSPVQTVPTTFFPSGVLNFVDLVKSRNLASYLTAIFSVQENEEMTKKLNPLL